MITRFKIFEKDYFYKLGDYVLIYYKYKRYSNSNLFAKIVDTDESYIPYLVLFSNGKDFWIDDNMIDRKLNSDEIEKYELEIAANKYNL